MTHNDPDGVAVEYTCKSYDLHRVVRATRSTPQVEAIAHPGADPRGTATFATRPLLLKRGAALPRFASPLPSDFRFYRNHLGAV